MLKKSCFFLVITLCFSPSCVRQKLYRAELAARSAAQAREETLQKEVDARKKEVANLTTTVGGLNRTIGHQDTDLNNLAKELEDRIQQMGKSSGKLASEKMELEKQLAATKSALEECDMEQEQIRHIRAASDSLLFNLRDSLAVAYKTQPGVIITIEGQAVTLNLPDKSIFDAKGLQLGLAAKPLLTALAKVLTNRPEIDVEVITYTDNVLPRNANLYDTWDWSLFRATNLVRALIQDFNVNANQLTPVGRGEFYPLASNGTAEGRLKNRRTEIVLHPAFPTGK